MTNSMPGQSFFASPTFVPVFTPNFFASTLAAMHTVVSAIMGTTPSGFPRSAGSTCCSTDAKYELKSTSSDRRVIRRYRVRGRLVASMNLRRKTSGSAMFGAGSSELPVPEITIVPKLRIRPQKPWSTRRASTWLMLISMVRRVTNPNFAMMRLLVIAISVERTLTQAHPRKMSPTPTTSRRIPSRTSPNCDHHETCARCTMVSPSTSDWSMYDTLASEVGGLEERLGHGLQAAGIFFVETREPGAVQVHHADDLARVHQRNHDLAARSRIACDVAGKRVDVGHDDRAL